MHADSPQVGAPNSQPWVWLCWVTLSKEGSEPAVHRTDNPQRPTYSTGSLLSAGASLDARGVWGRMGAGVRVAESFAFP